MAPCECVCKELTWSREGATEVTGKTLTLFQVIGVVLWAGENAFNVHKETSSAEVGDEKTEQSIPVNPSQKTSNIIEWAPIIPKPTPKPASESQQFCDRFNATEFMASGKWIVVSDPFGQRYLEGSNSYKATTELFFNRNGSHKGIMTIESRFSSTTSKLNGRWDAECFEKNRFSITGNNLSLNSSAGPHMFEILDSNTILHEHKNVHWQRKTN